MLAVACLYIEDALALAELLIRLNRLLVPVREAVEINLEHVNMGRHLYQMACIGHQCAQDIGGLQGLFRRGRHLHQMNINTDSRDAASFLRRCLLPI